MRNNELAYYQKTLNKNYNTEFQNKMMKWLCCESEPKAQEKRCSRRIVLNQTQANNNFHQNQLQNKKSNKDYISKETKSGFQQKKIQVLKPIKDQYSGEQLNGVPHGTGTMHYINGDYYKGQWVNGQKQGKGQHYYFDIHCFYNGEWKHNVKNGNGHQTESNGSWYEGEFKDGLKHGKGINYDKQLNVKYAETYINGHLKERKEMDGQNVPIPSDEFPTLKWDKERFNTDDLTKFEEKNPEIKEVDLDFLLKYYALRKFINIDFIDSPISDWTIKQVHLFLDEVHLSNYKPIFYENKIKGKDLASLDEEEMKKDLQMKLGDRKILISYIDYFNDLTKTKKKDSKSQKKKRRGSLSIKKKKQSLLGSITRSIEHQIIEEDDQWNEPGSEDEKKSRESLLKVKNKYETQKWDKFNSIDHHDTFAKYESVSNRPNSPKQNENSNKTEKESDANNDRDIQISPSIRRKRSGGEDITPGRNSAGKSINIGHKKQSSSTSSDSSNHDINDILKMKQKKSASNGPSQEIRELYQFLRQNQSLDFIIKQKDIQIIEQIGEGGYGKVSRGKYMQYPVAVKDYMKAGRSHKSRQEFMKQVHVLSDLKHPNIVLYMGLCITVNRYQLVTQFMENGSLYDQLHIKKTKFNKEQQLQIIDDIVQGMVYLHNMKDMLHRDLKSSNVLIAEDYKVKLCDFGLSGHKKKNKKQKQNRIGTYQWMAPEVIRNEELDFYSDVYSFGVILWEILTQQIPYFGMSQTQIIGNVGFDNSHKLPSPPKSCDKFIEQLMKRCLNRNSAERPTFIHIQQLIQEERKKRPIIKDVWANL